MTNRILTDADTNSVAELVLAAQAGDTEAFGELMERYERSVFTTALRRLRNYAEAQELCQEVFAQALVKLCQLRRPECFGGWLRSIARRMAINRAVRRAPDVPIEPEMLAARCVERGTPLTAAIKSERRMHVRKGLARLRDLDRRTLEAFYMQGRSLIQMSDEFDAPLGTIKRRLHIARKRLAKEVEAFVTV